MAQYEIKIRTTGEVIAWLTTDSPMSHYGIPALRFAPGFDDPGRSQDYGPVDLITHGEAAETFGPETAAEFVKRWIDGQRDMLPAEAIDAAKRFLAQWPEGPQIAE
jgi:hypothetical protein